MVSPDFEAKLDLAWAAPQISETATPRERKNHEVFIRQQNRYIDQFNKLPKMLDREFTYTVGLEDNFKIIRAYRKAVDVKAVKKIAKKRAPAQVDLVAQLEQLLSNQKLPVSRNSLLSMLRSYRETGRLEYVPIAQRQVTQPPAERQTRDRTIKDPNAPASKRQTWLLFKLTGRDYRSDGLNMSQAGDLIDRYKKTA